MSRYAIEVKNVYNLSIAYLDRFFGKVGKIKSIEKD
jgi:hypothetical protein